MVHPNTPACISQYFGDFGPIVDVVPDFEKYRAEMYDKYHPHIVQEIRNDSDDLLDPEAVSIYAGVSGVEVGHFQEGYYDSMKTGELYEWDYPANSSPQFGVHIIPGKDWAFNYKGWFDIRGGGMHTSMRYWDHRVKLPGRMFMVLGNGSNASKQERFCGNIVNNSDKLFERYGLTSEIREKYWELSNAF